MGSPTDRSQALGPTWPTIRLTQGGDDDHPGGWLLASVVEWWALDAAVGLVGQRAVGYMRTTLELKTMPQINDALCSPA